MCHDNMIFYSVPSWVFSLFLFNFVQRWSLSRPPSQRGAFHQSGTVDVKSSCIICIASDYSFKVLRCFVNFHVSVNFHVFFSCIYSTISWLSCDSFLDSNLTVLKIIVMYNDDIKIIYLNWSPGYDR